MMVLRVICLAHSNTKHTPKADIIIVLIIISALGHGEAFEGASR